ncbi:MAG: aldehyde dehydrogenase, partial [Rhodococcus sp. (in: high G+C Gram-positive bacteria)]
MQVTAGPELPSTQDLSIPNRIATTSPAGALPGSATDVSLAINVPSAHAGGDDELDVWSPDMDMLLAGEWR